MRLCLATLSILGLWLFITACKTSIGSNESVTQKRLSLHADSLKVFARVQNANTGYGILIDMDIPSSKKRYFLVDFNKDSVILSGMCAHGRCSDPGSEEVEFSNIPQSRCSSRGKYRVGDKYDGEYGKS